MTASVASHLAVPVPANGVFQTIIAPKELAIDDKGR
jgi:hypothetical protein